MSEPAPGFTKYPDYEVTIEPSPAHVRVLVGDVVVADTHDAVVVRETRHRDVLYLPFASLDQDLIEKTDTDTYCPFKGHASYWTINAGEHVVEDAIWRYEDPYQECEGLEDYVAFYTNKVTFEVDGQVGDAEGPGWVER